MREEQRMTGRHKIPRPALEYIPPACAGRADRRSGMYGWIAWSGWVAVIMVVAAPSACASGPWQKLARGVMNTATGWLECPFEIASTTEIEGSLSGLSVGVVRGLSHAVTRTVVGVWETGTFLFANHPHQTGSDFYGPLIEPEFIVFRRADKS